MPDGRHCGGHFDSVAFVLVVVAILWAKQRFIRSGVPPLLVPPLVTKLFLAFCFALTVAHLTSRELGPAYSSRIDELSHFSTFTSIENLLWPLLIQLLLLEEDTRLRAAIVSVLMMILALTPYRAVTLAIYAFAFALPLAYALWDAHRLKWAKGAVLAVAGRAALVALIGGAIFLGGVVDSQTRAVTATPQSIGPEVPAVELSTKSRIRQRLAFPLYQAAIVSHLSTTTTLPTIIDELERKFRLSNRPNLNEYVYKIIYPGSTTVGETTSLYYGEGAAYFGKAELLWTLGAPLLFVVAWPLLSGVGLDAGAILSVALWRSSFAGFITILPALLLQLAALFVMSRLGRVHSTWFKAPILSRLTAVFLLISILAAASALAWASLDDPQRRDLLRLEFAADSGCEFDRTTAGSLPDRVDQALSVPGRPFKSMLSLYTPARVYLVVPYGKMLQQHLSEFIAPVSSFIRCKNSNVSSAKIDDLQIVSSLGTVPLNVLTLTSTIMAAVLLCGVPLRAVFLPSSSRRRSGHGETVAIPDVDAGNLSGCLKMAGRNVIRRHAPCCDFQDADGKRRVCQNKRIDLLHDWPFSLVAIANPANECHQVEHGLKSEREIVEPMPIDQHDIG